MSYRQLSTFEHTNIEALSKISYSVRQIVGKLNSHHSMIAYEIKRSNLQVYQAELADELAR